MKEDEMVGLVKELIEEHEKTMHADMDATNERLTAIEENTAGLIEAWEGLTWGIKAILLLGQLMAALATICAGVWGYFHFIRGG